MISYIDISHTESTKNTISVEIPRESIKKEIILTKNTIYAPKMSIIYFVGDRYEKIRIRIRRR